MSIDRIGPFALEEPLDGLPQGNVRRAIHLERKQVMVVKLLPREVAQSAMGPSNFAQDIKLLQQLEHPGIACVLGGAIEQGQPYLVLEYVPGETLRDVLDRRGKLPWEAAVELVDQISLALVHAHSKGVVHRRLTPERVLITPEGQAKIVGFDCHWVDHDEVVASRAPMNVAHYLSPEQYRGHQSATYPQCDLFSLGVILYECLTGVVPWPARTVADLRQARRESAAPRISTREYDCPVWIDALAEKLLAKVRSQRLKSADETHRAIVIAKSKAESGTGAAQHMWSGKEGMLALTNNLSELKAIKRRRFRPKDTSPFYERVWFLASCLIVLLGFGAWVLWPASEAELFAKAKPLMESDDPVDWKRAEQQYLEPLLKRFPDSVHASEIAAFHERVAMHRAEQRIINLDRFGRQPKSAAERAYAEGWHYEQFGDRLSAWQKYDAVVRLFGESDDPDQRVYAQLARRQIARFRNGEQTSADLAAFVQEQLEAAQRQQEAGQLFEARRILDGIVSLYEGNRELSPLVEQAREQLQQLGTAASD